MKVIIAGRAFNSRVSLSNIHVFHLSFQVEEVLEKRKTKGYLEYKVRWKNYDSDDDTWEPVENLRDSVDVVDRFNEKMLRKHGLIQPIKIKIKSSKNKGYSGGTLLTLKNPVSPKPMNSPSNMGGNKVSNSKRTDGGVRRIRGLSSRIEQDKKLTKLSQKLSYDDYMDKSNRAVNRQKLKNKMQELAQMSPGTRNRRLMSSSSPMSLECVAENLHKKTKTLKRKSKRLPESPDNSDDAESNMAYPLTSDLLMASTSSSEPRTNLGSNSIKSGIPSKKTKRSHSVAEVRSYVVDGIVSFPKKRNNSYRGAGGGGGMQL